MDYNTVQEGLADPQILEDVKKTVLESASALEKIYGFAHENLVEYMNAMIIQEIYNTRCIRSNHKSCKRTNQKNISQ